MQCMLAVSPRFLGPDNTPLVVLNLSEPYPTMELQAIVPEVLKKIVTTYDMVSPLGPDLGEQIEVQPSSVSCVGLRSKSVSLTSLFW